MSYPITFVVIIKQPKLRLMGILAEEYGSVR